MTAAPPELDAILTADPETECPTHGAPTTRDYEFGEYADATVYKHACGCCSVAASEDAGGGVTTHPSYPVAAGHARLIVAMTRAKYGR